MKILFILQIEIAMSFITFYNGLKIFRSVVFGINSFILVCLKKQ